MNNFKKLMALEAISFQDGSFFKGLTQAVKEMREKGATKILDGKSHRNDVEVVFKPILDIIKKKTNLNIFIGNPTIAVADIGPAAYIPPSRLEHILLDRYRIESYQEGGVMSEQIKKILRSLDNAYMEGSVSIKDSRVSGFFSKLETFLFMPYSWFLNNNNNILSDEEVAAVILHEVGHIFTGLELCNRTMRTNQVLSAMAEVLDPKYNEQDRRMVFVNIKTYLSLSNETYERLIKSKNGDIASIIIYDEAISSSIREIGASVYDTVSAEQLADQFATRHGSGKHLVTALDKFTGGAVDNSYTKDALGALLNSAIVSALLGTIISISIGTFIASTAIVFSLYSILTAYKSNRETEEYDNLYSRYDRIRMQMVEGLKNLNLPKEDAEVILKNIDSVNALLGKHKDKLGLYQQIAYVLKPSFRSNRKAELLEKELEQLATNDLFISSAKLKTF